MSAFKTVRGMRDFLPEEAKLLRYVESIAREVAKLHGYGEVITPVVESYELLATKSGEEIRERMYAFKDLGGRRVALRPEFTASIARLVATTLRNEPKPLRLFCAGSLYRYDEPQYGRFREFWQSNYELIGTNNPEADAEVILITNDLMEKVGLRNFKFKIGHVGILRGILSQEGIKDEQQNKIMQLLDKKEWEEALTFARELGASKRCVKALKNLIKIKGDKTSQVLKKVREQVQDYEDALDATENLRQILELLKESGAKPKVYVDAGFARGLEYYTGMIYEVYVKALEIALGGGGRYDKLVELFGGESTPAVGVAHGTDRIVFAMKKQGFSPKAVEEKKVMVIPIEETLRAQAIGLALRLKKAGIAADVEIMRRTVTKALQDADRRGANYAILVGMKEFKEGKVVLRNLEKREQETIRMEDAVKKLAGYQERR